MRVKYKYLLNDIRIQHNLESEVTPNDRVYIKIKKGMPGLKHVAKLVCDYLRVSLEPYGCEPIPVTVGLWRH